MSSRSVGSSSDENHKRPRIETAATNNLHIHTNNHANNINHQQIHTIPPPNNNIINNNNTNLSPEVQLTDQGTALKLAGHFPQAIESYLLSIKANAHYAPAYYNLGVIYSEMGQNNEAIKFYQLAIEHNPLYVEAHSNLGVIFKNSGKTELAIELYEKALSLNPNFTVAANNLAIALTDLGTAKKEQNLKESLRIYKKALVYNPFYAEAYYNLGVAYSAKFDFDKAIMNYELAAHFNSQCCEAFNNLGVLYKERGNLEKSVKCYLASLAINPTFPQTLNNLAVVYTFQGKLDEAYECVKNAIKHNPDYSEAYNNLGVLYRDEGKLSEALICYEKCLKLDPLAKNAAQNRLLALNYVSDISPQDLYESHKSWGDNFLSQFQQYKTWKNKLTTKRILKIGYISPDFFTHSVSYFIESLLANHNSNHFHITCYSNVSKEDSKTKKLKTYPQVWKNIFGLSTEQASNMIYNDEIDVLIELTGHTSGNRLDVIATKPAPIIITHIGYPNTTGLRTVDYRITDSLSDPENTTQLYVEKLIRLKKCFLCYYPCSDAPSVSPAPCIKNNFVTFGSFNNLGKISPQVSLVWAKILEQVPGSRLVIKSKPFASAIVKNEFMARFTSRGIDPSRIDLLSLLPFSSDHLRTYCLMDLSLDTWPYAGTTTTCESLWMGVPVLTLTGTFHAQNVGRTLLMQVGLTEFITNSEQEYIEKAISLSNNRKKLQQIRDTLRDKMISSPLCNAKEYTSEYESNLSSVWQHYCQQHHK